MANNTRWPISLVYYLFHHSHYSLLLFIPFQSSHHRHLSHLLFIPFQSYHHRHHSLLQFIPFQSCHHRHLSNLLSIPFQSFIIVIFPYHQHFYMPSFPYNCDLLPALLNTITTTFPLGHSPLPLPDANERTMKEVFQTGFIGSGNEGFGIKRSGLFLRGENILEFRSLFFFPHFLSNCEHCVPKG